MDVECFDGVLLIFSRECRIGSKVWPFAFSRALMGHINVAYISKI